MSDTDVNNSLSQKIDSEQMQRRMYDGEAREWAESMEAVLKTAGPEKAKYIVRMLLNMLHRRGE